MAKKPTDIPRSGLSYPSTSKTLAPQDVPTDTSHGSNLPPGTYKTNVGKPEGQTVYVGQTFEDDAAHSATPDRTYSSTAAAFPAGPQRDDVLALEPRIRALPEMLLVAIGHGDEPAGPHLGNPDLPEGTLKPLVAHELIRRQRRRDNIRWAIATLIVGPLLFFLGVWMS